MTGRARPSGAQRGRVLPDAGQPTSAAGKDRAVPDGRTEDVTLGRERMKRTHLTLMAGTALALLAGNAFAQEAATVAFLMPDQASTR